MGMKISSSVQTILEVVGVVSVKPVGASGPKMCTVNNKRSKKRSTLWPVLFYMEKIWSFSSPTGIWLKE